MDSINTSQRTEIKEGTETASSTSFLEIYLKFDTNGQLYIRLYDKRDDFNFSIINFPHFDSNIPNAPTYGVYISKPIPTLELAVFIKTFYICDTDIP